MEIKLIEKSEKSALYSIVTTDNNISELENFLTKFENEASVKSDFDDIAQMLLKILVDGALERFFRPEGKMSDNVCALSLGAHRLRLYCIRYNDQIIIVGNGGLKTTRTYDENEELAGYVMDLQRFEKLLRDEIRRGNIRVDGAMLENLKSEKITIITNKKT